MGNSDLPPENVRTVESLEISFRIIEGLERLGRAGVTELAVDLDLPKSTVHKHLATLRSIDCAVKDDGAYRLSLRFLGLGLSARSYFQIANISQEPLEKLADKTGRIASLVLPEHDYCVHVLRSSPDQTDPLPFHEGERLPIYATAGGKAILAYMPKDRRKRILDRVELTALTDETITNREKLMEEIRHVYDRRQAYDRGEYIEDLRCIAAPITDENQLAIGAITITDPAATMTDQAVNSDIMTFLGSSAHSIETRLDTV